MTARTLPLLATIAIFALGHLVCSLQHPDRLSTRVIGNLLTDNAYLGIVAVGMTGVILSGGSTCRWAPSSPFPACSSCRCCARPTCTRWRSSRCCWC